MQDGKAGMQAVMWWDAVCAELLPHKPAQEEEGKLEEGASTQDEGEADAGGEKGASTEAEAKKTKPDEDEEFFSGDEGEGGES